MKTFIMAALLLFAPALKADSWPGPREMTVFSDNGQRFVRVITGENLGGTVGFRGSHGGANARAHFYRLSDDRSYQLIADVMLANPVAPVDLLLSNGGYLITFDNWHNAGFGKVVAIYDPAGNSVASYELEQLYGQGRVKDIPTSVSSRWWRCKPHHFVDPGGQSRVYVREAQGGYFVFNLNDGTFEYTQGNASCE